MDKKDCVNIFLSEGAGLEAITREMEAMGGNLRCIRPCKTR